MIMRKAKGDSPERQRLLKASEAVMLAKAKRDVGAVEKSMWHLKQYLKGLFKR